MIVIKFSSPTLMLEDLKLALDGIRGFAKTMTRRDPLKMEIVDVGKGSVYFAVSMNLEEPEEQRMIRLLGRAMASPKEFLLEHPEFFTPLSHLAQVRKRVPYVVERGGERIAPADGFSTSMEEIARTKMESPGMVMGYLHVVQSGKKSLRRSRSSRVKFKVYNPFLRRDIECVLERQELVEEALKMFDRRVRVYGVVEYDGLGFPRKIKKVARVELAEADVSLIDLEGSLALPEGEDSVSMIRKWRDQDRWPGEDL